MLSQRSLEAFKSVIATGSASAAAQALSISQPAVSRHLRALEDRLDLMLFTRFGNSLVPTEAARLLADEVENAFVGLSMIEASARRIKRGEHGALKLAAMPVIATTILADVAAQMCSTRPECEIEINAMRTQNIIPLVARRQAALGFVSPRRVTPEVSVLTHDYFPYRCIMQPNDPLAAREFIVLSDLAGRDFIGYTSATTTTGLILDRLIAKMPTPPRVRVHAHLSATAQALVLRGVGIAIVDPFIARDHVAAGGVSRPVIMEDAFGVSVIAPHGIALSADGAAVMDIYSMLVRTFGDEASSPLSGRVSQLTS